MTSKGPLATKVFTWLPDKCIPQVKDYGLAKLFEIGEHEVFDIYELAAVLDSIASNSKTFIVRGRPVVGIDRLNTIRRHHTKITPDGAIETATLEATPHYWIPLDIDSLPCPQYINPVHDIKAVVQYVVSMFPPEFCDTTVYYQYTSSAGIKPGIRIRLYYWSEKPVHDAQLKTWLAEYPVDLSIFTPSQPIYTAKPIFIGMQDPVPRRSGLIIGKQDALTPRAIGEPDLLTGVASITTSRPKGIDATVAIVPTKAAEAAQPDLFGGSLPTCSAPTRRRRRR